MIKPRLFSQIINQVLLLYTYLAYFFVNICIFATSLYLHETIFESDLIYFVQMFVYRYYKEQYWRQLVSSSGFTVQLKVQISMYSKAKCQRVIYTSSMNEFQVYDYVLNVNEFYLHDLMKLMHFWLSVKIQYTVLVYSVKCRQ